MKLCKYLEHHRKYTSGNETPEIFHIWAGLSALAGAAEKRIWLEQGYFKLYLNLYIILVSPAGLCPKTTAMNIESNLLGECGYNIMQGSILKEKIIEDLMACEKTFICQDGKQFLHASATYIASELNVLLSSGVDMVKFLVDIWDSEKTYHYKTKKSGVYEVNYPFFNMMAGAVPQWFGQNICQDMGATGFLARCIIVYADQKRGKYPRIVLTGDQLRAKEKCIEILKKMESIYGPIRMTPAAERKYDAWYLKQDIDPGEDYRMAGYLERRTKGHTLKVAALMAIGDGRKIIDVIDLERSFYLFDITEKKMRDAYLIAGANPQTQFIQRILGMVRANNGKIKMIDAVRALYNDLDAGSFRRVLESMQMAGMIDVVQVRATNGKKTLYIEMRQDICTTVR